VCAGTVAGFGVRSYLLAVRAAVESARVKDQKSQ
jgi:3-dehydroquinate dehydratase